MALLAALLRFAVGFFVVVLRLALVAPVFAGGAILAAAFFGAGFFGAFFLAVGLRFALVAPVFAGAAFLAAGLAFTAFAAASISSKLSCKHSE